MQTRNDPSRDWRNCRRSCGYRGRWLKLDPKQLKVNRGGRKSSECRHLSADQEKTLQKLIIDKAPDQLKIAYAFWTRKAVMGLIKKTGIDMPVRTEGEYRNRWGFYPAKASQAAYKQNPKAV